MNPYFNENTILDYIKQYLGSPYNIIELTDDEIVNNIILNHNYLKEFSQFFPKEERIYLNDNNNELTILKELKAKYPNKYKDEIPDQNLNRWVVESNNEILGIKDLIHANHYGNYGINYQMNQYLYANPIDFASNNLMRSIIEPTVTYKFYYPNIIEVKGIYRTQEMIAVLETVHDKDLSSIPSSLHISYNKLCLYNTANALYGIRSKYTEISTPFANINLNLDMLKEIADRKHELIQEFKGLGNLTSRALGIFVC